MRPRVRLRGIPHRRRRDSRDRAEPAGPDPAGVPRQQCRAARCRRRSGVRPPAAGGSPGIGAAEAARRARRVRQPAAGAHAAGARGRDAVPAGAGRGRRHPDRARTARRAVLRPAARRECQTRRSTRCATRARRSSAWRGWPSSRPATAAAWSRRWTRPTSWKPRGCGARPSREVAARLPGRAPRAHLRRRLRAAPGDSNPPTSTSSSPRISSATS